MCITVRAAIRLRTEVNRSARWRQMTGNKHNLEGNSSDKGEPDPGPYWRRMHRDWRFWIGAVFVGAALAIYVLTGDLAWVPNGHPQPAMPASAAN